MSERGPAANVLHGVVRLALFRSDGFAAFGATPLAFLNSLAPLLAFPLVGGAMLLLSGSLRAAAADLLASIVALLAPAVFSHTLAALWKREALWLRYAVAFNWCQAAITLATVLLVALVGTITMGRPEGLQTVLGSVVALLCYWLVLCWFMARRGLQISGPKAVLFVLVMNFGTAVLVVGPRVLLATLR
ncbi:hypothetical protein [Limobrevibacterium gyesilva]|uniref:Yip1 domain-containing protein n=1 Tax=Limobrevibacterium gyesilva TaxID=2991712 RepID=A0AA41YLU3_9PROT|nr:hypothetical protein [Limobrevibacterium gyesilva]MCW3474836.1 hypothetical protein [Limobrevibacterium gyesilva]